MTMDATKTNELAGGQEAFIAGEEGTVKVLIAEDEPGARQAFENLLRGWGYEVVGVGTGTEAWEVLRGDDSPRMAVLDWILPGMDGLELCRRVRELRPVEPPYLILLTGRGDRTDVVAGL